MTTSLRPAGLLLLACLLYGSAAAQQRDSRVPRPSPNATIGQTIGVTDVTINYGRPAVNGRTVFGELEPYGAVWRTGANEATTITFSDDVQVEGQPLAAGTYGLFTIPGEAEWTVVFNERPDQWGAFEYDQAQDALRVTVRPEAGAPSERVTFSFDDVTDHSARAVVAWDAVRVPFTITTDTGALVRAKAQAAMEGASDWRAPLPFVFYALENADLAEDAIGWADKSLALQENYSALFAKASLQANLGRYADAVQTGEKALALGRSLERKPGNLAAFETTVAEWKGKL